jgi:hypothetical protein
MASNPRAIFALMLAFSAAAGPTSLSRVGAGTKGLYKTPNESMPVTFAEMGVVDGEVNTPCYSTPMTATLLSKQQQTRSAMLSKRDRGSQQQAATISHRIQWDVVDLPFHAYLSSDNITTHSIFFYDLLQGFVYVIAQDMQGNGTNFPDVCYSFNISTPAVVLRTQFDPFTYAVGEAWEEVVTSDMPQAFLVPRATVYVPKLRVLYSHGPIVMRNIYTDSTLLACAQNNLFISNSTTSVPFATNTTYLYYVDTGEWVALAWSSRDVGVPVDGDVTCYGVSGMTHVLEPSGTGIIALGRWTCLGVPTGFQASLFRFEVGARTWTAIATTTNVFDELYPFSSRFMASGSIFLRPLVNQTSLLGYDVVAFGGIDWLRRSAGVVCYILTSSNMTWSISQSCDYSTGPMFRYDALAVSPHQLDNTTGIILGGMFSAMAYSPVRVKYLRRVDNSIIHSKLAAHNSYLLWLN